MIPLHYLNRTSLTQRKYVRTRDESGMDRQGAHPHVHVTNCTQTQLGNAFDCCYKTGPDLFDLACFFMLNYLQHILCLNYLYIYTNH